MPTFRQQEFARHFAAGLSPSNAAIAAGYAQSTATKNAYKLLKSPEVGGIISKIRQKSILQHAEITTVRNALMSIIQSDAEPKVHLRCISLIFSLHKNFSFAYSDQLDLDWPESLNSIPEIDEDDTPVFRPATNQTNRQDQITPDDLAFLESLKLLPSQPSTSAHPTVHPSPKSAAAPAHTPPISN